MRGLLGNALRKNVEQMALGLGEKVRSLQYFVGQSPWGAEPMIGVHQQAVGEENSVVLVDAAKVRIEPRARKGQPVPAREDWRDVKVGCWYQAEAVSVSQQSARQRQKTERDGTVFPTTQYYYYCDIAHVDTFGELAWATGCQVPADWVAELVFVCDGATWIWKLIAQYYPKAVEIVDRYHAEDHLKRLADTVFSSQAERQAWLAQVTETLWQGQVEEVILAH